MSLGSTLSFADVRAKAVFAPKAAPGEGGQVRLARRHMAVAQFVAQGFSNKEVAEAMGLDQGTVKDYISQFYKLTGMHTRVSIANWVHERGAHDAVRILKAMGVAA
jgi:DNA-binding NarL/FixJ family response regulator